MKNGRTTLTIFICLVSAFGARAQDQATTQAPPSKATPSRTSPQQQNLNEYISLLRKDVASQKFQVMDAVMNLNLDQSAKFWPIYRDYQDELTKINDQRVANIKQYTQTYSNLTDSQADELTQNAFTYQKERLDLLAKYYNLVKQSLGAVTAARFLQVEYQLDLIIDLQIESSLPVVGS
jgi:hypothetical protein